MGHCRVLRVTVGITYDPVAFSQRAALSRSLSVSILHIHGLLSAMIGLADLLHSACGTTWPSEVCLVLTVLPELEQLY